MMMGKSHVKLLDVIRSCWVKHHKRSNSVSEHLIRGVLHLKFRTLFEIDKKYKLQKQPIIISMAFGYGKIASK